jgi:Xaa-Pro aminopeptidase
VNRKGYGGEQYRVCHVELVADLPRKMRDVQTESCRLQARESKEGVRCQDVAKTVHDFQVKEGMAQYVYHRPGHGQAGLGHTPPYIALGDDTVLVEGMLFSNEPCLYSPTDGIGYGTGDTVLVTKTKGIQMGPSPMTKEWSFITL